MDGWAGDESGVSGRGWRTGYLYAECDSLGPAGGGGAGELYHCGSRIVWEIRSFCR